MTGSQTVANGGQTWSSARGAVMIDGTLYTGWADGTFKARTYNGTTFGAATNVNLNGLTDFANELPNITGMVYDKATGRLYYHPRGSVAAVLPLLRAGEPDRRRGPLRRPG